MKAVRGFFWAVLATLAIGYTLRAPILSGGSLGVIDAIDGRLMQACWEHVYLSIRGEADFFSPQWFSPIDHTLGYTDTFLLNGLVYSVFRYCGVVPLQAMVLTIGCYALLGFAGFYLMLQRLKIAWGLALAGALLFVVGAPIQQAMSNAHLQLLTIWLVPWVILAVWKAFDVDAENKHLASLIYLSLGLALYCLIAISTFYTAWFTLFVGCVVAVFAFALSRQVRRWVFFSALPMLWKNKYVGVVVVLGLGLFLYIYLPVRAEMGGRSFGGIVPTLPDLKFFGYSSHDSIFWKEWLGVKPFHSDKKYLHEVAFSFPWFFLVSWLIVSVMSWRLRYHDRDTRMAAIGALSVFFIWALLLSVGGFSLWWFVLNLFPGADAIRAVFRINMVVYAVALVVVLLFANTYLRPKLWGRVAIVCFVALFVVEGWIHPKRGLLSLEDEQAFAERVEMMRQDKPDMSAFLIVRDPFPDEHPQVERLRLLGTHAQAMRVSQELDIPTVNGYSGQFPKSWDFELRILEKNYQGSLAKWINMHPRVSPVSVFNWDRGVWNQEAFSMPAYRADADGVIVPKDSFKHPDFEQIFSRQWSFGEKTVRWSDGYEPLILITIDPESLPAKLRIVGDYFVHGKKFRTRGKVRFGKEKPLSIDSSQRFIEERIINVDSLNEDGSYTIEWDFLKLRSPTRLGLYEDDRRLGLSLKELSIVSQ